MRVDAGTSFQYASQRPQASAADRSATSFSAALTTTQTDSTKQADFSNMTRHDMRDWVNTQIRSGEMSLDDSRPFMAMTMKIPVGGGLGGELPAESDGTRYDFTQKVRDGIQGALSRNDETSVKILESAMKIIQRYQGQTIGLNVRA
ncbi:MAG: hypothetical protein WCG50_12475 [Rhodoferax sp.]|uniref:hypothetical protein n=1 Tax=Rhodoferax sp. TaxID=50421 RepID=UPI0030168C4B